MTIESPTNAGVFQAYVLAALLLVLRPGNIVVLDNLGAHKTEETLVLFTRAAVTFRILPAYSHDLDPIKKMCSRITVPLCKAQVREHTTPP